MNQLIYMYTADRTIEKYSFRRKSSRFYYIVNLCKTETSFHTAKFSHLRVFLIFFYLLFFRLRNSF